MNNRAAVNIIGATGEIYDFVSLVKNSVITTKRVSKGFYEIYGSLGLVPFPPINIGWGYTINQIDSKADVDINFENDILKVTVTKDNNPYDLLHMITLHILVPDSAPVELPSVQEEPLSTEGASTPDE